MIFLVVLFQKNLFQSIQKGFETSMTSGVLAGYPVNNMKVRIFDGSYHDVDSDAMSFELCAKSAFSEAGRKAKPTLLEPIMKVEVLHQTSTWVMLQAT
jgi:elongation factor G